MDDCQDLPPFLRLPLEIRLMIYNELLVADTFKIPRAQNMMCVPDYHEYTTTSTTLAACPENILSFRNIGPPSFNLSAHTLKHRSTYKIRSDRFRARCIDVTYNCVNLPDIHTSVLGVNHQIHNEAAELLYSSYTFDFDSNIEACVPFLMDLTPFSRSSIQRIGVVKRALPYDKDFDRCEWTTMCQCISTNLEGLTALSLGIVSGKPAIGWDSFAQLPQHMFEPIVQKWKRDEMAWVRDLMMIKGLQQLQVRACVEHCPPPQSESLGFFVEFSASVESGFKEYLTSRMIEQEA